MKFFIRNLFLFNLVISLSFSLFVDVRAVGLSDKIKEIISDSNESLDAALLRVLLNANLSSDDKKGLLEELAALGANYRSTFSFYDWWIVKQSNNSLKAAFYLACLDTKLPFKMVKLLADAGADINDTSYALATATTALIQVSRFRDENVLKDFLELKPNLNIQDKNGKTALMYASEKGTASKVVLLIDAGADTEIVDNNGNTALDMANNRKRNKSNENDIKSICTLLKREQLKKQLEKQKLLKKVYAQFVTLIAKVNLNDINN